MHSSCRSTAQRRAVAWALTLSGIGLALGLRTHTPLVAVGVIAATSLFGVVACLRHYTRGRAPVAAAVIVDGPSVPIVHFADDEPRVLCCGWFRPRVFVSTGALFELPCDRLRTLVVHHRHHARRRDPLRLLAAYAVADGLPYLPIVPSVVTRFRRHVEALAVRSGSGASDVPATGPDTAECPFARPDGLDRVARTPRPLSLVAAAWALISSVALSALVVHAAGLLELSALDPSAPGGTLCLLASLALLVVGAATATPRPNSAT